MAKFTIHDIFNGNKYNVMESAITDHLKNGRPIQYYEITRIDVLIVKHTIKTIEKMKKDIIDLTIILPVFGIFGSYFAVFMSGTFHHAALIASVMLAFQNTPIDSAMFYDARISTSIYGSMFNPLTKEPFPAYYGFAAFNELYRRKNQVELCCDDNRIFAVAAKDENGCLMIANPTAESIDADIISDENISNCKLLAENLLFCDVDFCGIIPPESIVLIKY